MTGVDNVREQEEPDATLREMPVKRLPPDTAVRGQGVPRSRTALGSIRDSRFTIPVFRLYSQFPRRDQVRAMRDGGQNNVASSEPHHAVRVLVFRLALPHSAR